MNDLLLPQQTNHQNINKSNLETLNLDKLEITTYNNTQLIDKTPEYKHKKFINGKRKSYKLARSLKLANPTSKLTHQYEATERCCNTLFVRDGLIHTFTCKSKFCDTCNRKKASKQIEAYTPEINQWIDRHFLTLTRQSVRAENIGEYLINFSEIFKKINNSRQWSKKGIIKKYLRKLEFTYNPETELFHLHFHLITHSKDCAELIKCEWIRLNNQLGTELKGKQAVISDLQDIRSIDATEKALKEIVKYVNKFDGMDDLKALNKMLEELYKKRTIQAVGFKVASPDEATPDEQKLKKQIIPDGVWKWNHPIKDYVSQYGEVLSDVIKHMKNYKAPPDNEYIN